MNIKLFQNNNVNFLSSQFSNTGNLRQAKNVAHVNIPVFERKGEALKNLGVKSQNLQAKISDTNLTESIHRRLCDRLPGKQTSLYRNIRLHISQPLNRLAIQVGLKSDHDLASLAPVPDSIQEKLNIKTYEIVERFVKSCDENVFIPEQKNKIIAALRISTNRQQGTAGFEVGENGSKVTQEGAMLLKRCVNILVGNEEALRGNDYIQKDDLKLKKGFELLDSEKKLLVQLDRRCDVMLANYNL